MDNYLDYTFEVTSSDIDIWGYLKLTTLLSICQDVAYVQSSAKGMGFDTLIAQNMAWVLSRIKVSIEQLPVWHDRVRVRTWHKRQSGLFSLRDYIFYDEQDNPIIRVTSSWLIINLTTRRINRVDKVFNSHGELSLVGYPMDAIEADAERVDIPSDICYVGEHKVQYSDMDVNKHVNNTKYVEWACDHSKCQMDENRTLKGFCVNFNHEAKYGDEVSLSTSDQNTGEFVIAGSIEDRNIFAVSMEYTFK